VSQVLVFLVRLDLQRVPEDAVWRSLAEDERGVAERFIFDVDRYRYVGSHYFLRSVLADVLDETPRKLVFVRAARGKPQLQHATPVQFNLSHAGNLAAVAVTHHGPVGVDIETQNRKLSTAGIARQILTPVEWARWQALPEPVQRAELLRYWGRKEALLKATGHGLRFPPRELMTASSGPMVIERLFEQPYLTRDLPPDEDFYGAVAAAQVDWQLTVIWKAMS